MGRRGRATIGDDSHQQDGDMVIDATLTTIDHLRRPGPRAERDHADIDPIPGVR